MTEVKVKVDELAEAGKMLEERSQTTGNINFLFLDLSSSCTGFCVVSADFANKNAVFKEAGSIWFSNEWDHQEKYHYIFSAIVNYFNICSRIDYCFMEQYMLNPKRISGCQISPELHGAVSVALAEINVKYSNVPVSTWRKHLGIKKNEEGDYKQPTKIEVEKYVKLPTHIKSNITGTLRALPSDVPDAIAIALGTLKKFGFKQFNFTNFEIQKEGIHDV